LIKRDEITISSFKEIFAENVRQKEAAHIVALQRNPTDLLERAKGYGIHYRNGSWGWCSNIWHRSARNTVVVDSEEELRSEHRDLMLSVLEHMLCRPMIQVDRNLGSAGTPSEMRARLYCDPQFPDIAYRWGELNFPGDPSAEPDAVMFHIPHCLSNPRISENGEELRVLRFPHHGYTIVTVSSYQGETKKAMLSHWIHHVYRRGGTGEHASLKEFTIKRVDGRLKRIVMCAWGLTGSGKSTHGMYIINEVTAPAFIERFGVDPREFVSDQTIKNDDIVGVFEDRVYSPEKGSWTKTEGVDEHQFAIHRAGMAARALHENTEWDAEGNVSFEGALFQYRGVLNQNARTVLMLQDTGYFDGNVNSTEPLNMAVFISPGYNSDYAWLKLNDPTFAAKVLADGRTVGHPAQSLKGVGEEKYETRYCRPFTMGASSGAHMRRFHEFLQKREHTDNPIEVYQINTTGRVGSKYEWTEHMLGDERVIVPKAVFEDVNGKKKPIGGTGPSIAETELFLFQAARGAVRYEPHPIWGEKVLVPVEVPGISKARIRKLNPFNYRSEQEMRELLQAQIRVSKYHLTHQCAGLPEEIRDAMDF